MLRSSYGAGAIGSTSLGTNYAGDTIRLLLVNFSGSTTPGTPSGYTSIRANSDSTNGFAMRLVTKSSTGGESMPSTTNTTHVGFIVYSGVDAVNLISNVLGQAGSGTSASYSGVVSYPAGGNHWVGTDYVGKNSSGVPTAPTSTPIVVSDTSGGYIAMFDSGTPLASYSFNSKAVSTSTPWMTSTMVIRGGASGGPGAGGGLPIKVKASGSFVTADNTKVKAGGTFGNGDIKVKAGGAF